MIRRYWHDGVLYDADGDPITDCTWCEALAMMSARHVTWTLLRQAPPS